MRRAFWITITFFTLVFAFTVSKKFVQAKKEILPAWQHEVNALDQQIEELEEMKRGYEARALRHDNQAQRLQFRNSEYLTAKRHWEIAEENRKIADRIQKDIDALKKRKQEILRAHGKK